MHEAGPLLSAVAGVLEAVVLDALSVRAIVVVDGVACAGGGSGVGGVARAGLTRTAAGGEQQGARDEGRRDSGPQGARGWSRWAARRGRWRGRIDHGHSVADDRDAPCDPPVTMPSMAAQAPPTPDAHTHAPGAQQPRHRRHIDWELIVCGLRGHVLVGRDAATTRPQDAPLIREEGDLRWHRCLRCDAWVPLIRPDPAARPHPPERDEITLPLRGQGPARQGRAAADRLRPRAALPRTRPARRRRAAVRLRPRPA